LFRSDHYLSLMGFERDRVALDAWATISALAAVTSTLRLGTLVSPVTFRHPSELAKVAATADQVSGGRVELGMGAGWNDREHDAFGFPFPPMAERFALFEEQVEVVRRLTTEEVVDHDGAHYRLDAVRPLPAPVQSPLPLLLGGQANTRSAALAARFADEYNSIGAGPDGIPERRDRLAGACQQVGRDPDTLRLSLMTTCVVGRDEDELYDRAAAVLARTGNDRDPREWVAARAGTAILGTVEQAAEQLAAYAAVGVQRIMLQHLAHDDLDMVELIGSELIPAVT
jgi:alkanesulfonate monooxygenase SsuD/methylene tetrahydromethanopterin reductase-like flavin-dependent oxidoreductase (luciferase family)